MDCPGPHISYTSFSSSQNVRRTFSNLIEYYPYGSNTKYDIVYTGLILCIVLVFVHGYNPGLQQVPFINPDESGSVVLIEAHIRYCEVGNTTILSGRLQPSTATLDTF